MKKLLSLLMCLLIVGVAFAQNDVAMADTMRSNGKIYVVVGVLMIIFIGLVFYMISLDRKISKLEKKDKE